MLGFFGGGGDNPYFVIPFKEFETAQIVREKLVILSGYQATL